MMPSTYLHRPRMVDGGSHSKQWTEANVEKYRVRLKVQKNMTQMMNESTKCCCMRSA